MSTIVAHTPTVAQEIIDYVGRRMPLIARMKSTFFVDTENDRWVRLDMPDFERSVTFVKRIDNLYDAFVTDYENGVVVDGNNGCYACLLCDLPGLAATPKRPEPYRHGVSSFREWFDRADEHGPNLNPPLWDYEEINARTLS